MFLALALTARVDGDSPSQTPPGILPAWVSRQSCMDLHLGCPQLATPTHLYELSPPFDDRAENEATTSTTALQRRIRRPRLAQCTSRTRIPGRSVIVARHGAPQRPGLERPRCNFGVKRYIPVQTLCLLFGNMGPSVTSF